MAKKVEDAKNPKKQSEVAKAAKGLFYGMALHGMVTYALRLRMHMENLFMLILWETCWEYPCCLHTTVSDSCLTRFRR